MTVTSEKPTERKLLLGAYAIAELTTALDHLHALELVGVRVPPVTIGRIEQERLLYMRLWWGATHGSPLWQEDFTVQCVQEARQWVTDHVVELDDIIKEEEQRYSE